MIDEEATYKRYGYHSYDWKPKSSKKIVCICDQCGKVRFLEKKGYLACCKTCSNGGKVKRICETCGKEFELIPALVKHGGGRFHSRKCYGKWLSKHHRGENHPNWQGGKVMRICETCGKEFPVDPNQIKKGEGKFCSPKCYGKWASKHRRGKNNTNWQGGISFGKYCSKFNFTFKEYIRDKFGRVCFLCPKTEKENGKRLSVHHVNYNKSCGCDGDKTCQFVPLCVSCNSKVNKNRDMWEKKIKDMMKNKLNGWYI